MWIIIASHLTGLPISPDWRSHLTGLPASYFVCCSAHGPRRRRSRASRSSPAPTDRHTDWVLDFGDGLCVQRGQMIYKSDEKMPLIPELQGDAAGTKLSNYIKGLQPEGRAGSGEPGPQSHPERGRASFAWQGCLVAVSPNGSSVLVTRLLSTRPPENRDCRLAASPAWIRRKVWMRWSEVFTRFVSVRSVLLHTVTRTDHSPQWSVRRFAVRAGPRPNTAPPQSILVDRFNPFPALVLFKSTRICSSSVLTLCGFLVAPIAPQLGYGPVIGSHTSILSRLDVRPARRRLERDPSGTVGDVPSPYGEVGARGRQRVEPASPRVLGGWYGSGY